MDKTSTFVIVGLLLVGVGFFFVLFFTDREALLGNGVSSEAPSSTEASIPPSIEAGAAKEIVVTPKTVVTAKHAYRSGAHVVAGEIPLPTPCHILDAEGKVSDDRKTVMITFISSVKTGELCAQVITPARFKVSVKASQGAKLSATVNGQPVTLNLIEAGVDDDLDNFELYIKG